WIKSAFTTEETYPLPARCSSDRTNRLNALLFKILLPSNTDKTTAPTMDDITNINDRNIRLDGVKEKSNPSFETMLNAKLQTIQGIPERPAIPTPGITNISNTSKITPIANNDIAQFDASPSK